MVTFIAASVQISLAIAACWVKGRPRSRRRAACRYVDRADSTAAAMSASRNWMPWNSAIGCPNCCLSFAYDAATSSAACARPVAHAAMPSRPESRADKAIRIPSPSSPIRFERGTRTLS